MKVLDAGEAIRVPGSQSPYELSGCCATVHWQPVVQGCTRQAKKSAARSGARYRDIGKCAE